MHRDRSKFNGHDYKPKTEEERLFCRLFDAMFDDGGPAREASRQAVPVAETVRQFFGRVEAKGDFGYLFAARLLREEIENRDPPRETLSPVLTCMARLYVDGQALRTYKDAEGRERPKYPESRVHHVGRVLAPLIVPPEKSNLKDDRPVPALIAWCEDMESGTARPHGSVALERQETSIIRGAFFSAAIDHRKTMLFWERAVAAKRFPWRIFSDPCRSERGAIFSTTQLATIAGIMGHAPEAAVRRIAGQIVECAVHKRVEERHVGLLPFDVTVPATAEDRRAVCDTIVVSIDVPGRQALARELFRPVLRP